MSICLWIHAIAHEFVDPKARSSVGGCTLSGRRRGRHARAPITTLVSQRPWRVGHLKAFGRVTRMCPAKMDCLWCATFRHTRKVNTHTPTYTRNTRTRTRTTHKACRRDSSCRGFLGGWGARWVECVWRGTRNSSKVVGWRSVRVREALCRPWPTNGPVCGGGVMGKSVQCVSGNGWCGGGRRFISPRTASVVGI